jgi:ComF family protein
VAVLELLLPQRCVVCSRPGVQVCDPCRVALPRLVPPLCERCGAPTAWPVARCAECSGRRLAFASARAAVAYDDAVRALVREWKERGLRRLAGLAADLVAGSVERPDDTVLVPVPADRDRSLKRGHEPAVQLARELGRRWELPVERLLRRSRGGVRQRGLSQPERRANVRGAFAPAQEIQTRIVLIDDVYTTGSTANAAASALRKGGARRVDVVTFARTIRIR